MLDRDKAVWCVGAGGCAVGGPTTVAGVTIIPGVEVTVAQHEHWAPDGPSLLSQCPRLVCAFVASHSAMVTFFCYIAEAQKKIYMSVITRS